MIEVTKDIRSKFRTAFRKARAEKIRVIRLENDLYYVARRAPNHNRYLVKFFHRGKAVSVVCATIYNEGCRGSWQGRMCVHIAASIDRAVKHGFKLTREERDEAA